jgi:organic radical activating enzyme
VLVTGGEPTWHDLDPLTVALRNGPGVQTALETSGVYPITGRWDWVCVSPKPDGRLPFRPAWLSRADELKWIVGSVKDVRALEAFLAARESPDRITVQPISCGARATEICTDALMAHPEWRLSVQLHKYLGLA